MPETLIHRAATRCSALGVGGQDCHAADDGAHGLLVGGARLAPVAFAAIIAIAAA